MAFRHPAPVHPMSRSRRTVEDPTKPLHPTSTGHMVAFQPASLQSSTRSAYLARFRSLAASMPSSHGTVSSTNKMVLHGSDHMIRSGQSEVSTISLGNWSCLPRSTLMFHSLPDERTLDVILWWGWLMFSPALANRMRRLVAAAGLLLASCLHDSATSASFLNTRSCHHL